MTGRCDAPVEPVPSGRRPAVSDLVARVDDRRAVHAAVDQPVRRLHAHRPRHRPAAAGRRVARRRADDRAPARAARRSIGRRGGDDDASRWPGRRCCAPPTDRGAGARQRHRAACPAIGLVLVVVGKMALGRSFGIVPANRGVVVRGPYTLVRHPIYTGYLITHVGVPGRASGAVERGRRPRRRRRADRARADGRAGAQRRRRVSAVLPARRLAPGAGGVLMGVALINERTREPVATPVELAATRTTRRRGLLGRDGLDEAAAMMLAPCAAVHTASCASRSTSSSSIARATR